MAAADGVNSISFTLLYGIEICKIEKLSVHLETPPPAFRPKISEFLCNRCR